MLHCVKDASKDLLLQLDNVQFTKFLDAQQPLPDESITYQPPEPGFSTACTPLLLCMCFKLEEW
jgi:hypothetical protein